MLGVARSDERSAGVCNTRAVRQRHRCVLPAPEPRSRAQPSHDIALGPLNAAAPTKEGGCWFRLGGNQPMRNVALARTLVSSGEVEAQSSPARPSALRDLAPVGRSEGSPVRYRHRVDRSSRGGRGQRAPAGRRPRRAIHARTNCRGAGVTRSGRRHAGRPSCRVRERAVRLVVECPESAVWSTALDWRVDARCLVSVLDCPVERAQKGHADRFASGCLRESCL